MSEQSDTTESSVWTFDAILKRVGGASRYQFLVFSCMTVALFFPSMMSTLPVYIAYKQKYRCRWNESSLEEVPGNGSLVVDRCFVYRNESPSLKVECTEWDFDTSIFESTIRSKYLLVCGTEYLAELSTTMFFLGFTIGSVFYGYFSDRLGRMTGILVSGTHLSVCGVLAAFAPTYTLFAVARFLSGAGNGGLLVTAFTLMAEVISKRHRIAFCLMVHNGFSLGGCLFALIGYFVRDCFQLQLIVALSVLTVWAFPLVLPESPRWLYTSGRMRRAESAVRFIARCNGRALSDEFLDSMFRSTLSLDLTADAEVTKPEGKKMVADGKEERTTGEAEGVAGRASILEVMRERPLMVVSVINWYSWFTVSIGFFSTVFTVGDIGGNIFFNLFLMSLIEIPGRVLAIFTARRWGRIPTVAGTLLIGGACCLVNAILVGFSGAAKVVQAISIMNKFWFAAAFDTIWTYSSELYPTVIRNVGVGLGSMWARFGGMLAPQFSLLFDVWLPLPLLLMGLLPFVAGVLVFLLPETLNKDMLEDVKDMLRLVIQSGRTGQPKADSKYLKRIQAEANGDAGRNETV